MHNLMSDEQKSEFFRTRRRDRNDHGLGQQSYARFLDPVFAGAPDLQAAARGLGVRPHWHFHDLMVEAHSRADWCNVPADLRRFAGRLVLDARKSGVPLYVSKAHCRQSAGHEDGRQITVAHGVHHAALSPAETRFIRMLGERVASKLGVPVKPHLRRTFYLDDCEPVLPAGEPLYIGPRALAKH